MSVTLSSVVHAPGTGNVEGDELTHPVTVPFRAWLQDRHYAGPTVAVYCAYLSRAAIHLERRGATLEDATLAELTGWWQTVRPTAASRNQARKALVAYYRSIGRRTGDPADGLEQIPEPHRLPRPVEDSEFRRLIGAAVRLGGTHRTVGLMLAYTGCRIGELQRARWDALELGGASPVWYIEGKGSRRRGHKTRQVPLHPRVVAELTGRRASSDSVWVFPSGRSASGHLSQTTLRQLVYDIAEAAGLPRVVPHRYRHTVATTVLAATKDLTGLQNFLGHESAATTQLYTRVAADRLRSLLDVLPDDAA